MTGRAYPLPRPESGNDPRFTIGLQLDMAQVLAKHGFPEVHGVDLVELGLALFRFLYALEERPAPATTDATTAMGAHLAIVGGWRTDTRVHCPDCGSARPVGSEDQACPWCPRGTAPAGPDDSPLTLAEYRSALDYWERKASEAQAAGLRGEFDRRMEGVVALRKSIRRLAAEGGAQ